MVRYLVALVVLTAAVYGNQPLLGIGEDEVQNAAVELHAPTVVDDKSSEANAFFGGSVAKAIVDR